MSGESNPPASLDEAQRRIAKLEAEIRSLKEEMIRVNRERIEYLQNVAHQIVAPLNAMKWHLENVSKVRAPIDRAKKVSRSIYSQATLAVHLAKNFALMSNLEGDRALSAMREPLEPIDLKRLLINLA